MKRRQFLQGSAAGAAGFWIAGRQPAWAQEKSANGKLNVAVIGVGGMRGEANTAGVATETLAAVCDVEEKNLAKVKLKYPDAKQYHDFREMLEKEKGLDAVVVSTPDHIHAPAVLMAMRLGKHVYTEKPMAHTVAEARLMAETAAKQKVATQMGTQIHAEQNYRRVVELIQAGAIGKVSEVHVMVGGAWTADALPKEYPPCPKTLHWDLWLGPAEERPYHPEFQPINWRKWWHFGGGHLADMGCHHIDLPFWALGLRHPKSVEAEGPPVNKDGAPPWLIAHWEFEGGVKLTWYHGDKKAPHISDGRAPKWGNGCVFIGSEGVLAADYGRHLLWPEAKFKDYKKPEKTIADSIGHHAEWVRACKGGPPALCNFDYAGALTECVLLGNVAYRSGKKFEWDAQALKAKGCPEADAFLRKEYRKGWAI